MSFDIFAGSDLACECMDTHGCGMAGVTFSECEAHGIKTEKMRICTAEASKRLGKPIGNYITLHCGRIDRMTDPENTSAVHALSAALSDIALRICSVKSCKMLNILVAGLGNAELTADAIGPKTASCLTATRQLRMFEKALFDSMDCASISVIAPGVLGQTGIETAELLKGIVEQTAPDIMLVVDALAARSCERLASTVQLTDCGIAPGSGVGNHRRAIDRATMGIPVMALGIPTVVGSATLVYDALRCAGIDQLDEQLRGVLDGGKSFFVSPKECDLISQRGATLLSDAITAAFCGALFE